MKGDMIIMSREEMSVAKKLEEVRSLEAVKNEMCCEEWGQTHIPSPLVIAKGLKSVGMGEDSKYTDIAKSFHSDDIAEDLYYSPLARRVEDIISHAVRYSESHRIFLDNADELELNVFCAINTGLPLTTLETVSFFGASSKHQAADLIEFDSILHILIKAINDSPSLYGEFIQYIEAVYEYIVVRNKYLEMWRERYERLHIEKFQDTSASLI